MAIPIAGAYANLRMRGRVLNVPTELFGENSWIQVMVGQGDHA